MNKLIYTTLLLLIGTFMVQAQTQRMVLYEGFSNASCAPCASQNPTTNALLAANPSKVVAVKYQTNWPGVDPMNAQTQTWVGPRVTYYNITGVPATRVDGTGTSISQIIVDTRYAVASPFFMNISHSYNATGDSVYVQCVVKAAQDFTGSALVLQLAMVERQISFTSAPGTNGETNFYHVMRKMLPNANGTSLRDNWLNAESDTFRFVTEIPPYIYDLNQMAFIAFVQSNTNKAVHQSAKDDPVLFALYPKITAHNIPLQPTCNQNIDLQFTVKNQGSALIDSFTVQYGAVGETPLLYNWTGALASGQQAVITLPQMSFATANPTIYIEVKNPNGSGAYPKIHAKVEKAVNYISSHSPIPVSQTFTAATFPPANWIVLSDDDLTWARSDAAGFGNAPGGSAMMNFFNSPTGKIDYLYMEPVNLTGGNATLLSFSVAHARYDATYGNNDRLQVEVSVNCGLTWNSLYLKAGATLSTAPNTTSPFVPTAAQWRSDTVNLSTYANQTEILVRFRATSGYGNNLYIDDIQLTSPDVSIEKYYSAMPSSAFPNPVNQLVNLEFNIDKPGDVIIQVFDNTGRNVGSVYEGRLPAGYHTTTMDASAWAKGLYHITITSGNQQSVQKVIKN